MHTSLLVADTFRDGREFLVSQKFFFFWSGFVDHLDQSESVFGIKIFWVLAKYLRKSNFIFLPFTGAICTTIVSA